MKKSATVLGLALAGLSLISCDNKDKTIAELTGKLLDMQTRISTLEALQNRVNILESMGQRVSNLEAAEKRIANLEQLAPRVSSLEPLAGRIATLEGLESRIATLETLPARVRTVEDLTSRVSALETLPPRINDLDKLASRVAVLEELVRKQEKAGKAAEPAKESTPVQRTMALLEAYNLIHKNEANASFAGHVARVEHGDAAMTDFPLLAEMLGLGDAENPVPLSCVKTFVDSGADVNAADADGKTPLMFACGQADPAMVRYLLEHGASCTAENEEGSALFFALDRGNGAKRAEIVRTLSAAGCDVNKRFANGNTPLLEAVETGVGSEVVQALLELGADVTLPDGDGATMMDFMESYTPEKGDKSVPLDEQVRELLLEAWEKAHIKDSEDTPATPTDPAE